MFLFPIALRNIFYFVPGNTAWPWAFGLVHSHQALAKYKRHASNRARLAFTSLFLALSFITIWNCPHERAHRENSARRGTMLSVTEVTHCPFLNATAGEMRWNLLIYHCCLSLSTF